MKSYLLAIATIFIIAGTATAQNINIGVKGGLNYYNVNFDNNTEFDSQVGLHAGLLGHIHLNHDFALQPELLFSMQGAETGNSNLKLDYINIPVLIQYMFDNGFRLQAGPQLGFLLNAKSEQNNSSTDVKDDFKSIDAGLSVGVSYVHPPTGFGVDARYNHGFSDITENSNVTATNRGFQLGVFYLFGHRN